MMFDRGIEAAAAHARLQHVPQPQTLLEQGLKLALNVYRGWVSEDAVRTLRKTLLGAGHGDSGETGTHTAMVRGPSGEEIHTDAAGRFRAQFHWDREATGTDADSRWIRYLQETATSQTLARTGWEVFVGYVDGDPDRPVGLGRAINGAMPPTYAQPASKNVMSLKTPSSPSTGGFNELKLDDSAGAQLMSLRAEKDLEKTTHTYTTQIDDLVKHKEGELLEV